MKTFQSKQGDIAYLSQGEGPQNFLLVHNSGGSHEMMTHTTDHYSKRGKVLAPDLLGHSASASPKIDYTITQAAENLIEVCKHENITKTVFIGLNYGADIGIEIAKLSPTLISHLILIEPPIFMEPWIVQLVEKTIKDLENLPENWAEETVDSLMKKPKNPERDIAVRALKSTPLYVKISSYKNLLAWDKNHSFTCPIPTLLIQTQNPFCTDEKARTVFSNLHVGRVTDSGPWANLEVPDQTHAMIDRFLELN